MSDLLNIMLTASGGLDKWKKTKSIYVEGQMGGGMVRLKAGFNLKLYKNLTVFRALEAFVHEQKLIFYDYPTKSFKAIFDHGNVHIEAADGTIVAKRENARQLFYKGWAGIRRFFYWDVLDFTYFLGYLFWNYLIAPYIFTYPGIICKEIAPLKNAKGERLRTLEVSFPPDIGTHAQKQHYLIDDQGLNVEMRYQLEIGRSPIMTWNNFITKYENIDGLMLGTQRRIFFSWDRLLRKQRKKTVWTLPMWGEATSTKLIPL